MEGDIAFDAPPNSLENSNVNPKVKISKEGVGVRSLAHNILGVKGAYWNFEMGIITSDKRVNYSYQSA
jgi:hypothetical protein